MTRTAAVLNELAMLVCAAGFVGGCWLIFTVLFGA